MVRATRGGGTRSVKYKRDMKLSEIFNDMIERYWPKTSREFGTKANTIFHIRDYKHVEFTDIDIEIDQYINQTNQCRTRVYLYSKTKTFNDILETYSVENDSSDDFEVNPPNKVIDIDQYEVSSLNEVMNHSSLSVES